MILTTLFDGQRETRELTPGIYLIGRAESCRIRFDLPEVSERHAILTVREGKATLEDLHSANGTLVNGELIDEAVVLDSGMVVSIGNGMLRVSEAEEEQGEGLETGDERREFAERWEFYWDGMELANCFTELCDKDEQFKRFVAAKESRKLLKESDYPIDSEFIDSLPLMGPAAGVALGVDRLVMVLTKTKEISAVRAHI